MYKYTVFECKGCKHREMYPSNTADGHKCKVCGSTIYIPIDTGLKVEMQGKYNIAYEPRQGREVTTTEYELLLKRFRHLMKSETIALYDEVDPRTGEYKRDIKELDNTYVMRSTCSRNCNCKQVNKYIIDELHTRDNIIYTPDERDELISKYGK